MSAPSNVTDVKSTDRSPHVAGALSASLVVHLVAFGIPAISFCSMSREAPYKAKLLAHRGEVSVVVQRSPAVVPSVPKVEARRPKPRKVVRSERVVHAESRAETKRTPVPDRERPRPISREIAPAHLRREALPSPARETERAIPQDETPPRTPQTFERRVVPSEPVVVDAGVNSRRLLDGVGTPRYPAECRAGRHRSGGCEGRGVYEVVVDETGRVVSARTITSAGCRYLDRAAVLYFRRRARFEIVEKDGKPVGWTGTRPVDYSLRDAE